jgi:rhodanese-related sulfurtransferase
MTATLTLLHPNRAAELLAQRGAVLIDIRETDEFARRHAKGAQSRPLSGFEQAPHRLDAAGEVIFTCRSGMRTAANVERLKGVVQGPAYILEGGLDAWQAAGLPVEEDRKAPLEIMRQVQIAAGLLVLVGVGLGIAMSPVFLGVAAVVGAGLTVAGATGFCGLARLFALMPWNRRAAA